MSRTDFFKKLKPYFSVEDIEKLEDYGVANFGCAPGFQFRGYDDICRLIYYAIGDCRVERKLESIIGRKLTCKEYSRLEDQMMLEW